VTPAVRHGTGGDHGGPLRPAPPAGPGTPGHRCFL